MPFGNTMRFGGGGWNAGNFGTGICRQVGGEVCGVCAQSCPLPPINATKAKTRARKNTANEGRASLAQRFSARVRTRSSLRDSINFFHFSQRSSAGLSSDAPPGLGCRTFLSTGLLENEFSRTHFSAGKGRRNESSPGGTAQFFSDSGFASGYRFSDTESSSKSRAP